MLATAAFGLTSAAMLAIGVPAGVVTISWLQPRPSWTGALGPAPAMKMLAAGPIVTVVAALVPCGRATTPVKPFWPNGIAEAMPVKPTGFAVPQPVTPGSPTPFAAAN